MRTDLTLRISRPCGGAPVLTRPSPSGRLGRLTGAGPHHLRSRVLAARGRMERTGNSALPELLDIGDPEFESKCSFEPYANWLIPGKVMLGRYPFMEPSRCKDRAMGEAQLERILAAGITTFVCLQDELPPQEQMRIGGENGFIPYKATADLIAAAMAGPPPAEVIDGLRNPNLDKFLPPRRKAESKGETGKELKYLHSPIVDLGIPGMVSLERLLDDLEARLTSGETLYIHCWGGRGRAGTVGSCLLAQLYGLSWKKALDITSTAFSTRGDGPNQSPETAEQVQFVQEFIQSRN